MTSSWIQSVERNDEGDVQMTTRGGKYYYYNSVTDEHWNAYLTDLENLGSMGEAFNANIKANYEGIECDSNWEELDPQDDDSTDSSEETDSEASAHLDSWDNIPDA
jgi:hypothetical protein